VKPSDEFSTIVAGVVSANTFQLLNAAGAVVAELGSTTIGVSPAAAIFMRHLDATVSDSSLAWTQSPFAGFQSVQLTGPKAVAGSSTPLLRLESVGTTAYGILTTAGPNAVSVQVSSIDGFSMVDQNTDGFVQSKYPGWNGYGAGTDTGSDVYYHRTSSTFTRVGHGDYSGGGGSFVEKAYVGVNGVTAAVIGENEAILRSGSGVGEYVQATGGNINIGPTTGRVNLALRPAWLPLGAQQFNLPASFNPIPGFAAFLMNGIAFTGVVGDQIVITCSARVVNVIPGAAVILQPQIFGPLGSVVLPQRIVASGWPANLDVTMSATWVYTLGGLASGAYVATIIGGQTGGQWALVAPDTWFTVDHYGIR
jgi:hypothetical protein